MDKELLATVIIPQYIRKVEISKAIREKYYKESDMKYIPNRILDKIGIDYQWLNYDGEFIVCDSNKKPVVANEKAAGQPKYLLIDGQQLHTLTLKDYQRSKIIKAIKEQMIPEVAKLEPINKYPLRIIIELHDTFIDEEYGKDTGWDVDNRGLHYCKVFPDVLQGCLVKDKDTRKLVATSKVIIPNDSRRYLTQPPVPLFFPISDAKDRKLVFKIYHDTRECILNNQYYGR